MSNPGVLFTVAYPQALDFLKDFHKSVLSQTRKDFDIIIVNDGCNVDSITSIFQGINVKILDAVGGFSANRIQGIDYARNLHYKYILFCDADDTFSSERYERTMEVFDNSHADIIVSNLNIVDEQCTLLIKDYFSKELPHSSWIDAAFEQDKNIFGMSNTAVRLEALKDTIQLPETPIVDWCLFTTLLLKGLKALYITDSLVNYRQYNSNLLGINKFDVASFRRLSELKINHYRLLSEMGHPQYQQLMQECKALLFLSDSEIDSIVKQELYVHSQPLWWQIITNNNTKKNQQ